MKIPFLAIVAGCLLTFNAVDGCEAGCRDDPTLFLSKRYEAILRARMQSLPTYIRPAVEAKIEQTMKQIKGRGRIIDTAIFKQFYGTCVPAGTRPPTELCGSAKAIACYAPWGQPHSLFDHIHKVVGKAIRHNFAKFPKSIREAMIDDVLAFCPENCQDWVEPFQNIMLVWEQREHPHVYRVTPNCLPLDKGGI